MTVEAPVRPNTILTNRLLIDICDALRDYYSKTGQAFVIRERMSARGELIKVFTHDTDHGVRLSILKTNPTNVHARRQKFSTVFDDEMRAGWATMSIFDVNTINQAPSFTQVQLNSLIYEVVKHLELTGSNARRPRARFPVKVGQSVPESKMLAAAFLVTDVDINKDNGQITLKGDNNLQHRLTAEVSAKFSNPVKIPGCMAVIHLSGNVRVLRKNNFDVLYEDVLTKE